MDPQQELFTRLLVTLREWGLTVYDGAMPPDNVPYPFVYLADSQQTETETKGAPLAGISQAIHVWHNDPEQRGTVSHMLLMIKDLCRKLQSDQFTFTVRGVDQRIITDTSTGRPLMHGILYVDFSI